MKPFWVVVLASLVFTPVASLSQQQTTEPCPDTVDTTGKYVNFSYGFSIVIPPTFNGVWNSASCVSSKEGCVCMSDHGRIIPLSGEADSGHWVEAYAGFATDLDEPTLSNAVASNLNSVRERSRTGSTSVLVRSSTAIGGVKAQRVVVRYMDKKTKRVMVEDFVVAFRGRTGTEIEYSIYLRSPIAKYRRDKAIFDQVLKSFALIECDEC